MKTSISKKITQSSDKTIPVPFHGYFCVLIELIVQLLSPSYVLAQNCFFFQWAAQAERLKNSFYEGDASFSIVVMKGHLCLNYQGSSFSSLSGAKE